MPGVSPRGYVIFGPVQRARWEEEEDARKGRDSSCDAPGEQTSCYNANEASQQPLYGPLHHPSVLGGPRWQGAMRRRRRRRKHPVILAHSQEVRAGGKQQFA